MNTAGAFVNEIGPVRAHRASFKDHVLAQVQLMPLLLYADIPWPGGVANFQKPLVFRNFW